jgi:hypothetical protein
MVDVKLKKIGVLKSSLFLGLFGFIFGLMSCLFCKLFFFIINSNITQDILNNVSFNFVFPGILFLIFPIAFAIIFFLCGIGFTLILNLFLKLIKGINLNLEEVEEEVKSY